MRNAEPTNAEFRDELERVAPDTVTIGDAPADYEFNVIFDAPVIVPFWNMGDLQFRVIGRHKDTETGAVRLRGVRTEHPPRR